VLYGASVTNSHGDELNNLRIADSMKSASVRIADFSRLLFTDFNVANTLFMSPLIPHSLYESAKVEFQSWKETKEVFCKHRFDSLKTILGQFRKRWLVAGMSLYLLGRVSRCDQTANSDELAQYADALARLEES